METRHRSPARVVAPVALVVCAVAAALILATAGSSDNSPSAEKASKQEQRDLDLRRSREARRGARNRNKLPQNVYVVKTGDTLGGIAEKTGVPVEKLQELNPNLDPQALVSGQRLKLR